MWHLLFNNADQFLAELRKDRDEVYGEIVRIAELIAVGGDAVEFEVIASYFIDETIVRLQVTIGSCFRLDSNGYAKYVEQAKATAKYLGDHIESLKLQVRPGCYK